MLLPTFTLPRLTYEKAYDQEQANLYYKITSGIPISEGDYMLQKKKTASPEANENFKNQIKAEEERNTILMIVMGIVSLLIFSRL
jgi:hypothetical protein